MQLNSKQRKFIKLYAGGMSGTKAAIAAGYSERSAHSQASRMLKEPKIKSEIDKLLKEEAEKTGFTKEKVIEEIKSIAFAKEGVTANNKLRALEMACKILGMFVEKVDFSGTMTQTVDFSNYTKEEIMKIAGVNDE
jgi:phage terminase small subunit